MEISSTDDGQMHLLRGTRSRTERLEIRTACGPVKECACRAVRQIYGYKTDGLGIGHPDYTHRPTSALDGGRALKATRLPCSRWEAMAWSALRFFMSIVYYMDASDLYTLEHVVASLVSKQVERRSYNLAGHAGAIQFEDLAHEAMLKEFPDRLYRHHEMLNSLYRANGDVNPKEREKLLGHPAQAVLLTRGKAASENWTMKSPFVMKQNDTAESILVPSSGKNLRGPVSNLVLVDVKSQDATKNGQPPNIISAKKLANAFLASAADDTLELPLDIVYVGVKWEAGETAITCKETKVIHLFKVPPEDIYINWAAAMQIQFTPFAVKQSYTGDVGSWARAFLNTYCTQLRDKTTKQLEEVQSIKKLLSSLPKHP